MVCIAAIAAHDSGRIERMGLRRALLTRRANLGDCADAPSVLRRVAAPQLLKRPACVVPLPRRSLGQPSTAELAVQVGREALAAAADFDPQSVEAILYCHATPDARTTDSTAGRLQFDLGLRRANPFSVSQAHNSAVLIALDMAAGLIEGPEAAPAVLLVAADKLLFGPAPQPARSMLWSDVAAAVLLQREARQGWRLRHVDLAHFDGGGDAHAPWTRAETAAFSAFGAERLRACLDASGLRGEPLGRILAVHDDAALAQGIHQAAGLPPPAPPPRQGRLSSADLLLGLSRLGPEAGPVLLWTHGHNGEFACAVMSPIV